MDNARSEQTSYPAMVPLRNKHSCADQTVEDQVSDLRRTQVGNNALRTEDICRRDDLHGRKPFAGDPLCFALVHHNSMPQYGSDRERGSFAVIQGLRCTSADKACENKLSLIIKLNIFKQSFIDEFLCHFSIVPGAETIANKLVPHYGACAKHHSECPDDFCSLSRRIEIYNHTRIDDEIRRDATGE